MIKWIVNIEALCGDDNWPCAQKFIDKTDFNLNGFSDKQNGPICAQKTWGNKRRWWKTRLIPWRWQLNMLGSLRLRYLLWAFNIVFVSLESYLCGLILFTTRTLKGSSETVRANSVKSVTFYILVSADTFIIDRKALCSHCMKLERVRFFPQW